MGSWIGWLTCLPSSLTCLTTDPGASLSQSHESQLSFCLVVPELLNADAKHQV